jgi:hypothetical protein
MHDVEAPPARRALTGQEYPVASDASIFPRSDNGAAPRPAAGNINPSLYAAQPVIGPWMHDVEAPPARRDLTPVAGEGHSISGQPPHTPNNGELPPGVQGPLGSPLR